MVLKIKKKRRYVKHTDYDWIYHLICQIGYHKIERFVGGQHPAHLIMLCKNAWNEDVAISIKQFLPFRNFLSQSILLFISSTFKECPLPKLFKKETHDGL